MASLVIQDFKAGLDSRSMGESTLPGALIRADNCVINQGGEVEKHEAWVKVFNLPDSKTYGMRVVNDITYVFGSEPEGSLGSLPQKVQYQQLNPAAGGAMTGVIATELFDGKIYAIATFDTGRIVHFYDGTEVEDFVDRSSVAELTLSSGSTGQIETVRVDGIDLLIGQVPFNTSLEQTAKDLADQINLYPSIPDYRATSLGTRVIISTIEPGTDGNGRTLTSTYNGIVVNVNIPTFAGGSVFPSPDAEFQPGTYPFTGEAKMNILASSILHYSHVNDPTDFDPSPAPPTLGEGFINLSNHSSGSESLKAMANYFDAYAILGQDTIQIWELDPDPVLNNKRQTIRDSGTVAPQSVVSFGNDTAYLDRSGVRSLRGRDSSNSANVNDIGTAIDPTIQDLIINDKLNTTQAVGTVDPLNGRYYLAIGEEMYIFNYFPGNKVSGWTKSLPGFKVDVFDQRELKIVARSGDSIYQLGGGQSAMGYCPETRYGTQGLPDGTGDGFNSQVDIITPFFDASDPSRFKIEKGMDILSEGKWQIFILHDPKDLSKQREVAKIDGSSLKEGRIPMTGHAPHLAFRFVSIGHEFSKISKILKHFDMGEQE